MVYRCCHVELFINKAVVCCHQSSNLYSKERQPFRNYFSYSAVVLLSLTLLLAIAMESVMEKDRSSSILSFSKVAL